MTTKSVTTQKYQETIGRQTRPHTKLEHCSPQDKVHRTTVNFHDGLREERETRREEKMSDKRGESKGERKGREKRASHNEDKYMCTARAFPPTTTSSTPLTQKKKAQSAPVSSSSTTDLKHEHYRENTQQVTLDTGAQRSSDESDIP